jgi:hypothetical protein
MNRKGGEMKRGREGCRPLSIWMKRGYAFAEETAFTRALRRLL